MKDKYPYQQIFKGDKFKCKYCGWDGRKFSKIFLLQISVLIILNQTIIIIKDNKNAKGRTR